MEKWNEAASGEVQTRH